MRNINNIIKEIMELRMQYLREYYAKYIGYSEEFEKEFFDDDIDYTNNNKKLMVLQEKYNLTKSRYGSPNVKLSKMIAGDMPVDDDWIEFLSNRYTNQRITESQFLLGTFIVFPDYGVLQESDMISIVEELTMSERVQSERLNTISEMLGISHDILRTHMMKTLKEHMNDYSEVKHIGIKQLKEQNRSVENPYEEKKLDYQTLRDMLKESK